MNHHTERVIHTMASVTPVVDQWLEKKMAHWEVNYTCNKTF